MKRDESTELCEWILPDLATTEATTASAIAPAAPVVVGSSVEDDTCKIGAAALIDALEDEEDEEVPLAASLEDDYETLSTSCSSLSSIKSCLSSKSGSPGRPQRHVSFNQGVKVQEYAVTLGHHPCNADGLALTLDWCHSDANVVDFEGYSSSRSQKYQMPKRLSFLERREKLFQASAHERNAELDQVIRLLHDSWQSHAYRILQPPLPLPNLLELEDEDDDDSDDEGIAGKKTSSSKATAAKKLYVAPKPMVMEWRRGPLQRQESFCKD